MRTLQRWLTDFLDLWGGPRDHDTLRSWTEITLGAGLFLIALIALHALPG